MALLMICANMNSPAFISSLLTLFCLCFSLISAELSELAEDYHEQLIIRPVHTGDQASAYFKFTTFVPLSGSSQGDKHNELFPLSLHRLFHSLDIDELHLSLNKGSWKYDRWGLPPSDASPNGQLRAWFGDDHGGQLVDKWNKLTTVLSAQFGVSIMSSGFTRPMISFRPFLRRSTFSNSTQNGFLTTQSREPLCTENLTPWIKLLPCQHAKGLASLLSGRNLFDSQFISLSIDFKYTCLDVNQCETTVGGQLSQSILVVFNAQPTGEQHWKIFWSLFNPPLKHYCSLASSSHILVQIPHINKTSLSTLASKYVHFDNSVDKFSINFQANLSSNFDGPIYADYDLKQLSESNQTLSNLNFIYPSLVSSKSSSIQFHRHSRGYGTSSRGIVSSIVNPTSSDIYVIYMDSIPWPFRLYLHTLVIEGHSLNNEPTSHRVIKPEWLHYEPAQDRIRPHHLEILLKIPAQSQVQISFDFDNQFLLVSEYPPDANQGFYINPATLTVFLPINQSNEHLSRFIPQLLSLNPSKQHHNITQHVHSLNQYNPIRLYTEAILIGMPLPDESMPYNVILFVTNLLAIAFVQLHNFTTRTIRVKSSTLAK